MKSVTLTLNEINRFIDLTKNLRHETPHQYERVRIKDGKIVLILYNSRKLVYNDNDECYEIINRVKGKKRAKKSGTGRYKNSRYKSKSSKAKNNKKTNDNSTSIADYYAYTIGSDETGKGEWYGPLVVTAVSTSHDENIKLREIGVQDSKRLSRKQILQLYEKIEKLGIKHETLVLKPFSYNKLYNKFKSEGKNLNHLLAYLHSKAITNLLDELDSNDVLIIIDKFDYKKMNEYLDINERVKIIQETNGERFIPVATGSIIAKYYFEKTLKDIEERYNINLRDTKPWTLDKSIADKVAKTHFKNVKS